MSFSPILPPKSSMPTSAIEGLQWVELYASGHDGVQPSVRNMVTILNGYMKIVSDG